MQCSVECSDRGQTILVSSSGRSRTLTKCARVINKNDYQSMIIGLLTAIVHLGVRAEQAFEYQWNIRNLVAANSDIIELRVGKNRLARTVETT